MNIVDPILFQCAVQPKVAALCAPDTGIGLISYGRLGQMIHNICRRVMRLGLGPGKIVAVSIQDPIFQTAVVLALTRLGVASVSRYDERILGAIRVDALIADKYPSMPKIDQIILADLSWTKGDGSPLLPQELPQTGPDDLCRIVLTSGTTGNPKGVAVSHRLLAERMARHIVVFGSRLGNHSRIFSDLPVTTSLGFQFLIHTLWRGGMHFFPGKTFDVTVDAFEEYKVQCWLSSPGGLEVLLKRYEQTPSLQSETDLVVVAGDILSRSLSDRAHTRICSQIVSVYGSTEASMTATAPVKMIQHIPGAVGFVNPGIAVEIVSESGESAPRGREGLVRVKSEFAVDHYMGDPATSARAFRDGWFYPGDIGVLDFDNVLQIVGRQDSLLNLGGDKINPEIIESVLAACEGVFECAAFGVPNELGNEEVFAAVVASNATDDARMRAHCEAHLSGQFIPGQFFRVEQLPRNAMGKVDRGKLPGLLKRTLS
jgi:acyl-coenzyme A synthetase/AMP-(fatty) acid ligase